MAHPSNLVVKIGTLREMKRLIVLLALCVAACTSSHHAPASPSASYVQHVRPYLPGWSKRLIVQAGHTVCGNIRRGEDFQLIVSEFTGAGIDVHSAGVAIGAAVHTFCPQFNQRLLRTVG